MEDVHVNRFEIVLLRTADRYDVVHAEYSSVTLVGPFYKALDRYGVGPLSIRNATGTGFDKPYAKTVVDRCFFNFAVVVDRGTVPRLLECRSQAVPLTSNK